MATSFVALNHGWNADPNAPDPHVTVRGSEVVLSVKVNAFLFPQFAEGSVLSVTFSECSRYRLGATNDEGWFMGQCRFSRLAPAWGEFYRVEGDLLLKAAPHDWVTVGSSSRNGRHFLFYLKDGTFECDATGFKVSLPPAVRSAQALGDVA